LWLSHHGLWLSQSLIVAVGWVVDVWLLQLQLMIHPHMKMFGKVNASQHMRTQEQQQLELALIIEMYNNLVQKESLRLAQPKKGLNP